MRFRSRNQSWLIAPAFYEYLLKAYIYNSGDYGFYLDRWLVAADSTIKSIGSHPYGHPELTFLSSWDSTSTHKRMESLSWFAGGSFIFGGMVTDNQTLVDYGLSIADAAGAVYMMTKTGLGAEFVTWKTECKAGKRCNPKSSIQIADGKFRLRPEVLETWYHAYRATKNPKYREWSWAAFEAINRHCRTDSGFSGIDNVNAVDGGGKTDVQESFIFAEVLKYLYLTHVEVSDINPEVFGVTDRMTRMRTCLFMSRTVERESRTPGSSTQRRILSKLQVFRYEITQTSKTDHHWSDRIPMIGESASCSKTAYSCGADHSPANQSPPSTFGFFGGLLYNIVLPNHIQKYLIQRCRSDAVIPNP